MSVLMTLSVAADTEKARRFMESEADRLRATGDKARAAGCLHHRFGIGDGQVIVVDEWESAEAFEKFFSDPELQQMVGEMGAQGEPDITFSEAVESADQF